jgi:hypothetical protein
MQLYCEEDIEDIDPRRNPLWIFSDDMDFECPVPDFARFIPMSHDSLVNHPLYTSIDSPKALFTRCDESGESRLCMWVQAESLISSTINFLTGRPLFYHVDDSESVIIVELSAFMYEQSMLDPPTHSRYIGHVAFKNDNTMMVLNPQQWLPTDASMKTIDESIAALMVPLSRLGVALTRFRLPHKAKLWCHYNKIRVAV